MKKVYYITVNPVKCMGAVGTVGICSPVLKTEKAISALLAKYIKNNAEKYCYSIGWEWDTPSAALEIEKLPKMHELAPI